MWAFRTLWDKGLIYEGYRVLWYCFRCETPLSATETKMDDTYRNRQDPAVTVPLRLRSDDPNLDGVNALIWTTTPWTLPSNLAAAVGPDIEYVVVESSGPFAGRYLLAQARLGAYARELGEDPQVLARYSGAQLAGTPYSPPFNFFVGRDNAHRC
jgi:isoleucyl-tRNA synthetase